VKLLVIAFVILGVVYGVYSLAIAASGWLQMSGVVDDVATREAPGLASQSGFGDSADRYGHVREGIMKGAAEAGVELQPENVAVGVANNMLDVRLRWTAPIVTYQGKTYVELPLSLQRAVPLTRPSLVR
jgi:hypothetical protein